MTAIALANVRPEDADISSDASNTEFDDGFVVSEPIDVWITRS
jgi:hypothetical protein